ncbi:hypothetical protein D3C85_1672070 [compost metagenome]
MPERNQVSSNTPPYKGLLEYLCDQVMAQLVHEHTQPTAPEPADSSDPEEPEAQPKHPSIFFATDEPGCTCTSCSVLRSLK